MFITNLCSLIIREHIHVPLYMNTLMFLSTCIGCESLWIRHWHIKALHVQNIPEIKTRCFLIPHLLNFAISLLLLKIKVNIHYFRDGYFALRIHSGHCFNIKDTDWWDGQWQLTWNFCILSKEIINLNLMYIFWSASCMHI